MKKRIVTKNRIKLNHIITLVAEYGKENEEKLIRFCLENGESITDIAKALEITPQALHAKYPGIGKEYHAQQN